MSTHILQSFSLTRFLAYLSVKNQWFLKFIFPLRKKAPLPDAKALSLDVSSSAGAACSCISSLGLPLSVPTAYGGREIYCLKKNPRSSLIST
ncbi:hypothetical protein HMPREF1147_0601 [Selenomonas sp. FOBRC9]|uniref:hypothetical protein n=1 Tax=Selenomonas sp. FOBRC9 TaxID=936573 RepID=UPI00027A4B0F|nr:hypothetical protein [Selenomonas sp. FOBRC9]EJP33912.1 hypothetical protein HMPREF1147_0601 [Selenomonas sp. FOBRC9]